MKDEKMNPCVSGTAWPAAEPTESNTDTLLQTLLDYIPDFIYFKDRQRRFVHASNAFRELLGRELHEIIGKRDEDLFPEDIARETSADDRRVIESGDPIINKMEGGESIGGTERWVLTTKIPWRDRNGEIVGLFGISREITEQRRTMEALRKSEVRFRSLVEQTTDAVFCYEYDPPIPIHLPINEQVKLLYGGVLAECNNICARAYGASHPEEVIGKKLTELFGNRHGSFDKLFTDLVQGGYRVVDGRAAEVLPDGSRKYFSNNGTGVIRNGKLIRLWGTFRDVTERKKMEDELLRSQKLDSIAILAGGIAHDLNNLLTAVVGNLSLARLNEDPEMTDTLLAEAERASMEIRNLSQQLLTFSKGGAPIKRTTDLGALVSDSAAFARSGSNVECDFVIENGLWPAEVDPGQIAQVIHNLVINAIQSMPEGGRVSVSARNVQVDSASMVRLPAGAYVRVAVEDRGTGIQEEHLQKIFDPFFTTKQSGSGLGLATCYSIVEKHHGHITAESRVASGTSVLFYLPASPDSTPVAAEEPEQVCMGDARILVMDDEKGVREVAEKLLLRLGCRVACAADGAEALAMYSQAMESGDPFAAVVLDLTVPGGIGGKQVIQNLIELDPEVVAVVSSGYSNDPLMARFEHSGFKGVLTKPYRASDLSQVLSTVLPGWREKRLG